MTQRLLHIAGIGKERLHLAWVSSAEAQRFVDIASQVIETVKKLGRLDNEALKMELEAAELTVNKEEIRWLVSKEVKITTQGDVYGRSWDIDKYEEILDTELEREYHNNRIILTMREGFTSVREISRQTGLELLRVSYLLADLERTGRVEFTGMTDSKPVFAAL